MTVTAAVITGVIFLEIFACVPDNWIMLVPLLFLFLTPLPLFLLRCCGDGDGLASSSPKGRHWAEFWSAFLFTSTIALPVLLYATDSLNHRRNAKSSFFAAGNSSLARNAARSMLDREMP